MQAKSATDLVKEAKAQIENLSPQQVQQELENGNITLIDIREGDELIQNGIIEGPYMHRVACWSFMPMKVYLTTSPNLIKTSA